MVLRVLYHINAIKLYSISVYIPKNIEYKFNAYGFGYDETKKILMHIYSVRVYCIVSFPKYSMYILFWHLILYFRIDRNNKNIKCQQTKLNKCL